MDTHKNARLTPKGREEMVRAAVDIGLSKSAAARRYNTTPKMVAKWVALDGRPRAAAMRGKLPSRAPGAVQSLPNTASASAAWQRKPTAKASVRSTGTPIA